LDDTAAFGSFLDVATMDTVARAVWRLEAALRVTAGRAPVVHDARSGVAPPQAAGAPQKAMSNSQGDLHPKHGPDRLSGKKIAGSGSTAGGRVTPEASRRGQIRQTSSYSAPTQGRTWGSRHVSLLQWSCRTFLPDEDNARVDGIYFDLDSGLGIFLISLESWSFPIESHMDKLELDTSCQSLGVGAWSISAAASKMD